VEEGGKGTITLEYVACPLCGSAAQLPYTVCRDWWQGVEGEFRAVRCTDCGLVFVNPRPCEDQIPLLYPDSYPAHQPSRKAATVTTERGLWRQKLRRLFFDAFYAPSEKRRANKWGLWCTLLWPLRFSARTKQGVLNFPASWSVLDVGSGSGRFLLRMRALGWKTYGVELDPEAAQISRSLGLGVVTGDLLSVSLPAPPFDVITMWEVIEHLPQPLDTLRRRRQLIASDGFIILSTPNARSWVAWLFPRWWNDIPRHLVAYSTPTLSSLLRQSGFEVYQVDYVSSVDTVLFPLEHIMRYYLRWPIAPNGVRKNRRLQRLFLPLVRLMDWLHLGGGIRVYARPVSSE
jgi:2-polyprenyl-3-methyl-5-hydroxy-6-metoxy-1,4-benzoquinol methylase